MNATKFEKIISYIPQWLPTIVVLIVILWLTLAPHPLGEVKISFFPGFDKVAHGLMFAGLTFATLFDAARFHGLHYLRLPLVAMIALVCGAIGVGIEYLQIWMNIGRSKEFLDMVADFTGGIVGGTLWLLIQPLWIKPPHHNLD